MKFDYFKLFELIKLEVEFAKLIKNSKNKNERIVLFDNFYPKLRKFVEEVYGNYGGFDPKIINVVYPLIRNKFILELGCGDGKFALFAKDIISGYVGLDIVCSTKSTEKIKFIRCNILSLPDTEILNNYKFDVIYHNDFVEHIYEPDLIELFDYLIKNCLKRDGVFITITPNFDLGHFDSIDYLKFPKGSIFGSHLTCKNSVGWANFYKRWGGTTKCYFGSYYTSHITKKIDCFILPPKINDFIIKSFIRNIIRIPRACVLKTIFTKE